MGSSFRYGSKIAGYRRRVIVGTGYQWRARYRTAWGYYSPWSEVSDFGISQYGHVPVVTMQPLGTVYAQPMTRWTWYDVDEDHVQDAYQIQLDLHPDFLSLTYDSGTVASANLYHQHSALANGTYYRRMRVRTNTTDWSEWDYDNFTLAAATSQSILFELFRVHPDGVLSKIYVPISSPVGTQTWSDTGGFSFVINNFRPFVERTLVACHHFDEMSDAVAHDIFGTMDLVLVGSPAWTSGVLNLTGGTQYGYSRIFTFDANGDWTTYLVVYPNGSSGCVWCIGDADDWHYLHSIGYSGSGNLYIRSMDAGGTNTSSNLTVPTNAWVPLRLKKASTTLTLTRLDTGASVTCTAKTVTGARIFLSIGCRLEIWPDAYEIVNSAKIAGHLLYSDNLTDTEDARNLAAYRDFLLHRGVTV